MTPVGRPGLRLLWRAALCVLGFCFSPTGWAQAKPDATASAGAAIYLQGKLPGGAALKGQREAGVTVEGTAAACVTCHRRSGLGGAEGRIAVPPIIGRYLFRAHATNVLDMSMPHLPGYKSTREPYTAETLARAIREGLDPGGRPLNYLMPRYALDDSAMASLTEYLRGLTSAPVPGVTDDTLHFATIVTPDADPAQRAAMVEVMTKFFEDKNAFQRGGGRRLQTSREIEYRVTRRWQLHVWDLTGPPDSWEKQLQSKLAAEPVFAVLSGLGGADWSPVHRFCERAAVPCLFPNVVLPVVAEGDFYPVYFTRGVRLEADLMADALATWKQAHPSAARLVQVMRPGDVAAAASAQLGHAAEALGLRVETRLLPASGKGQGDLAVPLAHITADDALALWLNADDVAALPAEPPPAGTVLLSGLMAGMENAPVPAAWRSSLVMSYPADLPELRKVRMNYALGWFKIRKIPIVSERIQTDTYIACGIVAETLTDMVDSFVREFLVERVETMLGHRLTNGYFPRLSLSQNQRFASKGGYLVRFNAPQGTALTAVSDWLVP